MDEKLKEKMFEYLSGIEALVKDGSNAAVEQLPLIAKEFIAWEFGSSIFLCAMFSIFMCISFYISRKLLKTACTLQNGDSMEFPVYVGLVVTLVIGCITASAATMGAYRAVKVSLAPRIVLIEKVLKITQSARR